MEKNSEHFMDLDMAQLKKIASSDAARQLFALLKAGDSGQLQQAMQQAAAGNMQQAGQALQQMLSTEQAQALVRQIQGEANG